MTDKDSTKTALPKGFAGSYDDQLSGRLDLNQLLIKHPSSTYFMRVEGDGLVAEGTQDGDLVIVDRGLTPKSSDLVIAVVDGALLLRQLKMDGDDRCLISDDGAITPLTEGQSIEVWGVVTTSVRQYPQ
jgi:DNA polymerase V